jgi:hypothetical protein
MFERGYHPTVLMAGSGPGPQPYWPAGLARSCGTARVLHARAALADRHVALPAGMSPGRHRFGNCRS